LSDSECRTPNPESRAASPKPLVRILLCHSERKEGISARTHKILRCAQDDITVKDRELFRHAGLVEIEAFLC